MRRPARNRATMIGLTVIATAVVAILIASALAAVGAGDDNIPGVPIPASSPFAGALDDHTDFDDVYAVPLAFNQKLDVSMTGVPGSQFDLWLWGPTTKNVFVDAPASFVVQSSQDPASSTERFWYPVRSAGTYYLHVLNPLDVTGSTGAYEVAYTITQLPTPDLAVQVPPAFGQGKSATITGTVAMGGAPLSGARVLVQSKAAGTSVWKDLNFDSAAFRPKAVADSTGAFAVSVKPSKKTQYRAVVWPTETSGWSRSSAAATMAPRVRLGAPHVPKSVRRKAVFTAHGYLAPRHTAKSKTVTLVFSKGSRVVRVKAANANYSSKAWGKSTKYKARVSLPSKGKWKVVATTAVDSLHAATTSAARYVTVR